MFTPGFCLLYWSVFHSCILSSFAIVFPCWWKVFTLCLKWVIRCACQSMWCVIFFLEVVQLIYLVIYVKCVCGLYGSGNRLCTWKYLYFNLSMHGVILWLVLQPAAEFSIVSTAGSCHPGRQCYYFVMRSVIVYSQTLRDWKVFALQDSVH